MTFMGSFAPHGAKLPTRIFAMANRRGQERQVDSKVGPENGYNGLQVLRGMFNVEKSLIGDFNLSSRVDQSHLNNGTGRGSGKLDQYQLARCCSIL